MRGLPEEFEASALIGSLADGWGFDVEAADCAAVGAGSYHWAATDLKGTRGFVTVNTVRDRWAALLGYPESGLIGAWTQLLEPIDLE